MIPGGMLKLILFFVTPIVEKLPIVSFSMDGLSVVLSWVNGVLYFLPMETVNLILGLFFATMIIRLVVSFLKTLWGILPLV